MVLHVFRYSLLLQRRVLPVECLLLCVTLLPLLLFNKEVKKETSSRWRRLEGPVWDVNEHRSEKDTAAKGKQKKGKVERDRHAYDPSSRTP